MNANYITPELSGEPKFPPSLSEISRSVRFAGGEQPNPQLQLPALVAESIPRRYHDPGRFSRIQMEIRLTYHVNMT